jgi:uncharacterized protein YjaG (DUF416 family)
MSRSKDKIFDGVFPDEDEYSRYMDVAQKLDIDTANTLSEMVHVLLKGTHATESDYLASMGKLYIKITRK